MDKCVIYSDDNMVLYDKFLRSKRTYSEKTKKKYMQYFRYLEIYLQGKPLKKISLEGICGFSKYIDSLEHNHRQLASVTKINIYSKLGNFFEWLSNLSGYKSVINYDMLSYFKLSNKEKSQMKRAMIAKKYPSELEVLTIIKSIESTTVFGRRDRAIIAYLFLTGARIEAASTMKIKLLDIENMVAYQLCDQGVKTKYSKNIETTIPLFNEEIISELKNWYHELVNTLGFTGECPLFPKSELNLHGEYIVFANSDRLSQHFMNKNSMASIVTKHCKKAGFPAYHCHSFRDGHVGVMNKRIHSAEEMKAISVNIGHENILTTIRDYGDIDSKKAHEIIKSMNAQQKDSFDFNLLPDISKRIAIQNLELIDPVFYEKHFSKDGMKGV